MRYLYKPLLMLSVLLAMLLAVQPPARADVPHYTFTTGSEYLLVEILDDDLAHVEMAANDKGPLPDESIYTSPMVLKTDYTGPSSEPMVSSDGNTIETSAMKLEVVTHGDQICVEFTDKSKLDTRLTTVCPVDLDQGLKGIDIEPGPIENVYGLGQNLSQTPLGLADGDRLHQPPRQGSFKSGQAVGNGFDGLENAAVGNIQIPVYYAVGPDNINYALLMDNVYWQNWDFGQDWWQARMYGDQLRFYFMTGDDLPDLRSDFMELTGTPPVPPRKAFGLWVSEFGYDNWEQVDTLKADLREDQFPLDGVVLDLNWFGGIVPVGDGESQEVKEQKTAQSNMGRLDWDENQDALTQQDCLGNPSSCGNVTTFPYHFENPSAKIQEYDQDDVRLTTIEESYLAKSVDTFNEMPGDLTAYKRTNGNCDSTNQEPVDTVSGFWGIGRMIDWSDSAAGQWFHDNRRFPNIVKKGINAHWTDLGEPETFDAGACYEGVETTVDGLKNEHSDIHNLYNLLWDKSIWDGYVDQQGETDELGVTNPRPFLISRSGAAGIQRYGAALWSGDIASSLKSLGNHSNAQMQMSFSGVDYYGADVGGFRREVMPGNSKTGPFNTDYEDELFTQWFANASWFDVPVRPHTDNEFNSTEANPSCASDAGERQPPCYETSPDRVGNKDSNLANLRQRYELMPYYYSLGYRAYLNGEPLMPPPLFYYQNDPELRQVGNEKLIGKDILVGIVSNHGEYERDVYLPEGKWIDYYSHEWVDSSGENNTGETVEDVPTYRDGIFRLPAFVKAGAILPQMYVDENTKDAFGHRMDDTERNEFIVNVYADDTASEFTLYEDDGLTLNYEDDGRPFYEYRTTDISQVQTGNTVNVTINGGINHQGTAIAPTAYPGAVTNRANMVKLVVEDAIATAVSLNGQPLPQHNTQAAFDAASSGWFNAGNNLVLAKSDTISVDTVKDFSFMTQPVATPTTSVNFICGGGFTQLGQSLYAVGNLPELGNWNPANAIKLEPSVYYDYIAGQHVDGVGPTEPIWTGVISGLPADTDVEWKCVRRDEVFNPNTVTWQPGDNNPVTTTTSGYTGSSYGKL